MRAMVLDKIGEPLTLQTLPDPLPGNDEVRLRVEACGVCRTDLHVVDGELPNIVTPLIPGHECVGIVEAVGPGLSGLKPGQRAGVPWLGNTCHHCRYCREDRENLCDAPEFTGYTRPGGFASHIVAQADYCVPLHDDADPVATAPLLCAGLIGWRCLVKAGQATRIGLYGFGAAALPKRCGSQCPPPVRVMGVVNKISIRPHIEPRGVKTKIEAALYRRAHLDAAAITVGVEKGTVTLTGEVDSLAERNTVEWAAWSAPGVQKVIDNLVDA